MSETPKELLSVSEEDLARELAIPPEVSEKFNKVMLEGDYSALTGPERSLFIRMQCRRAGLAPDLNPMMFINTGGKLVPYFKKGAAEQLRAIHGLNAAVTEKWADEHPSGQVHVCVRVSNGSQRFEDDIGSVSKNDPEAFKKAVTQAKRRATLGFCGMGALDPKEEVVENGHSNGPTRIAPPPVDPGSRMVTTVPTLAAAPTTPRPSAALPSPTEGGVDPPIAAAVPAIPRPRAKG